MENSSGTSCMTSGCDELKIRRVTELAPYLYTVSIAHDLFVRAEN